MVCILRTVPAICKAKCKAKAGLAAALLCFSAAALAADAQLPGTATANVANAANAASKACRGTIYLTFDTGSQSQAEFIASTLRKYRIKASFFLANEKTTRGDYSLSPEWAGYWKQLVADGHAFGSHTFDHVYVQSDAPDGRIRLKPQFGAQAGQSLLWTPAQYCEELKRVDQRFLQLTGQHLDPYWRAPGGKLTPGLSAAGAACGYAHVGWAPAGFSGDELSSEKFSNASLLQRMLRDLKDGDIVMAHLGIWSRRDPWAPANLEPLIQGLQQKSFCFATLREHPLYRLKK